MNENNILYRFLIDPGYRWLRHVSLIVTLSFVTFNQIFIAYHDNAGIIGNRIYIIAISLTALYIGVIYLNYFVLVPRYLLRNKYVAYGILLFAVAFFLPVISIVLEYVTRTLLNLPHRITNYTNPLILIDSIASSIINLICCLGITLIALFRDWVTRNEQLNKLEHIHLSAEVNKLKGQVTPAFLSKTLRAAAAQVKVAPDMASDILLKLGQLLRYQLYDCNRDKVLLSSEINFIACFLELEHINRKHFNYGINKTGSFYNVFVSPLLFITFIQEMAAVSDALELDISVDNDVVCFGCTADKNNRLSNETSDLVNKRLDMLYPEAHSFIAVPGKVKLVLNTAGV